ncbi:darcynin family protein [Paraherbaspirillum soli]|uniref:Darcynin family protein n=1 Tax=Paraherbaspirillum soli TaxID=631222 RepID=A0ABW0MEC1_9BURK
MTSEIKHQSAASTVLTVFMLVKTTPEWLGFSIDRRFSLLAEHFEPILRKHQPQVTLRFYDVEFYSARVTDIWVWDASEHHAYELLVEDLRETPFWDRYFEIVEILPGVENAYAKNYERAALLA